MLTWPKIDKKLINENLENAMEQAKLIVEGLLAIRQQENVKTRYPCLRALIELKQEVPLLEDVLECVSNQANVKTTEITKKMADAKSLAFNETPVAKIALDLEVTDEIKEERIVKELQRNIQQTRKKNKMHVKEFIDIVVLSKETDLISALAKHKDSLSQKIGAKTLEFSEKIPANAKSWKIKGKLTVEGTELEFRFEKA